VKRSAPGLVAPGLRLPLRTSCASAEPGLELVDVGLRHGGGIVVAVLVASPGGRTPGAPPFRRSGILTTGMGPSRPRTKQSRQDRKSAKTTVVEPTLLHGGKRLRLGSWPSKRAADVARDRAILYFGLNRPLRLPKVSTKLGPASPAELVRLARMRTRNKDYASPYFGVTPSAGLWRVSVYHHGQVTRVSGYASDEEAAVAYDRLALHLLGPDALLNFPGRRLKPASVVELRREVAARRRPARVRRQRAR
jgi:hypothetical protein